MEILIWRPDRYKPNYLHVQLIDDRSHGKESSQYKKTAHHGRVSGPSVVVRVLSNSHLISVWVIEIHPKEITRRRARKGERIKRKYSGHCFFGGSGCRVAK
jgi:hypothetical protein